MVLKYLSAYKFVWRQLGVRVFRCADFGWRTFYLFKSLKGGILMEKQITFRDKDKELIDQITAYQNDHEIKYFVEAVRQLCRQALSQSVNVRINLK